MTDGFQMPDWMRDQAAADATFKANEIIYKTFG